jgi:large subunit ribosomal protein L35
MHKHKTNKAAAKRLKVTARGKIRAHRTGAGHLKSVKSPKKIRGLRKETEFPKSFSRQARRLLGE